MAESIAVYARVRGSSDEVSVSADKAGSLVVRNLEFTLDSCFDASSSQEQVYDAAAAQQVERVLKGFNATILAYGQTGSGKTFTMMGPEDANFDDPAAPELGVVPRCCSTLFAQLPKGYAVAVSYVEVYNDAVNDLLGKAEDLKLVAQGASVVPKGLKLEPVTSVKDVMAAIKQGDSRRVVAAMQMNPRSSRGHGIVQIHVSDAKGAAFGRLTLADLAGMESSKKSSAVAEGAANPSESAVRREEAKRINTSLLALSSCISVLASKGAARVPYRDSNLTRLLQDSLGGNCKCAIVVTVRCEKQNLDEAINTLRFAQRAKNVTVNLVSNAAAREETKGKAARLADELDLAKRALGDFEQKLASSERHKETLLAEVDNLMEEMALLQRDANEQRERRDREKAAGATPRTDSELARQVLLLEAKVEQLEEENRILRQREIMRKMFQLGDEANAGAAAPAGEPAAAAGSSANGPLLRSPTVPAPVVSSAAPELPKIEFTFMRGFTNRQLVSFEPLAGFDAFADASDAFAIVEEQAAKPAGAKPKAAAQQAELTDAGRERRTSLPTKKSGTGFLTRMFSSKSKVTPSP